MARNQRPAPRNPVIWRKASAQEIAAAAARAAVEHEHHYLQHATIATHMRCVCAWVCRRDMTPPDLVFSGPVKVVGRG
jgi:hypothetical protein